MKLHRYPDYQDDTAPWLSRFPSSWRTAPFWSLFRRVKRTGHSSETLLSVYRDYGVVPRANRDDNSNKPSEDLSAYQLVEVGDLAINKMKAWQGSVAISEHRGIVSPAYFIYTPTHGHSSRFLHYLFRSKDYVAGYLSMSKGIRVNQWDLDPDRHSRTPVLLPSKEEQDSIVFFLDRETARIDGLIEKKTRFIELLDEREKAELSRLVRLGLRKNASLVDSGVDWRGMAPAHWTKGRIKDHFKLVKRQGHDNLSVLSVYREFGVIEKSSRDDNINKTPDDLSKYQLVEPDDLVINKMKAWQGSMGISSMRGITSPDYVVMRPIGVHDPRYLHHYFRARPMPWVYRLISNGIREDQWRMEPEKFLGLPIYLPPLDEQKAIAKEIDRELERMRNLISTTERSIELLKEKRAVLINAAVTGKIDVRNAA